ncbi:MAG: arabinofuranosidase catalytic domain-containing protein [Candidatus Solibacter sp.]
MKTRKNLLIMIAVVLTLIGTTYVMAQQAGGGNVPARPQGPCDVYAAGGAPCVAAHSSTRALYAAYTGPLYQVLRQSDLKTLDIGSVKPSASPVPDAGGYADAAAQDGFCANTYCWIVKLYDQSGKGNHLVQAPRGGFSGPAMGGFNNVPVADMAPITVMGHKAYGVFIEPGMGLRWNDAHGTAVDDQAEGQYWVIDGHHYNSGCCYDYGNAETDSRDDGNGTMETTYYGNANAWYRGPSPGPWIMTDQENNLVGCVNNEGANKYCAELPNITWRFVMATADGEPHHWRSMGGDAQKGDLKTMFDGKRVNPTYDPMRKQGAILLGNGGDNSVGSQGTFYEGAMTAPNTFPTPDTQQKVQANIVAAKYDVPRLSIAPASAVALPPGLQTFTPASSQETTVTFRNTTGAPATGLQLSISVPAGWTSVVSGGTGAAKSFAEPVAAGASVSATFKVTSGPVAFNGDLTGKASWKGNGGTQTVSASEKVRSVSPVKINEFRIGAGTNPTDSFIELYNAGASSVDISNWTLTHHPTQQAIFSAVQVPAGTSLAAKRFYLLGLSTSGLAVPASVGDSTIYVRSTTGMNAGDTITIGTGAGAETRKIASVGTASGAPTTLWQPLPDGPVITIPAGSTNVPFTGGGRGGVEQAGLTMGEKVAIGHGATYPAVSKSVEKYEVATITAVGKPGTQAWLTANAKAGDTNLKVSALANITAGDQIRLDIDSLGHGIETVTVKSVGTQSTRNAFNGALRPEELGTGLELTAPLKFNHASNIPFSSKGTGVSFNPKSAFPHSSNEPVMALGSGIKLDQPLAKAHEINAVVSDATVTSAGYQGTPKPNQWFGGPALGPAAGNMILRDGSGRVVDSLNFGGLVDPWAAEGYQAMSGAGANGCSVASPSAGGRGGGGFGGAAAQPVAAPNRSSGRFPDGADTDSNCNDFQLQTVTTTSAALAAGTNNIKVGSAADFAPGQMISIDTGTNQETAMVATVGTQGASTVGTATAVGATVIPVASPAGFTPGQAITIDSGPNLETAVVVASTGGRGGGGGGGGRGGQPIVLSVTVAAPLARAHAVGSQVSGTGITIMGGLTKAHDSGAQVGGGVPTPGAPNQYRRR